MGPCSLTLIVAVERTLGTHPMAALRLCAVAADLGVDAVTVLPAGQVRIAGHLVGTAAVLILQECHRHANVAAASGARL